jgi:hypothetical protein
MGYHNDTCGCADCGNYGQPFNPLAIHNQSCGCATCGNYPERPTAARQLDTVLIAVPVEFEARVRTLVAGSREESPGSVSVGPPVAG